jgi:hypothetical protein
MTNNSEDSKRRIDAILQGSYLDDIDTKSEDEVRELRDTAREIETEMSYLRRLAQSRLDIFKAEINRREKGGSLGDLIAMLPSILASGETRSSSSNSRLSSILAPAPNIDFNRGMETLVSDDSLANLAELEDDELAETIESLKTFEKEVSEKRKDLHKVIDVLEGEIATRTAAKSS